MTNHQRVPKAAAEGHIEGPAERRPEGTDAMLALQEVAGNRAVGRAGAPAITASPGVLDPASAPGPDPAGARMVPAWELAQVLQRARRHDREPVGDDDREAESSAGSLDNAANAARASSLPPAVADVVHSDAGRPLEPSVRTEMESRFGQDFSSVRVHTDAAAAASADHVEADAYTVGQDLVFGKDQYAPESSEGRAVLAHELAHVIQQARGSGDPTLDANIESGAARAADEVSSAGATTIAVEGASAVGLARQRKKPRQPAISHVEDDLQTVVFDRPVSLEEATDLLWSSPPAAKPLAPDPEERAVNGRQHRFNVDVKFEMQYRQQVTGAFRSAAAQALPQPDPVQTGIERGLPPEIAEIAPTLTADRTEVTDEYDVSTFHALRARWERFWGTPVVDWETEPGRKEITRTVDVLHRFPGVRTVHGKTFPADWLVKNKNGVVEAWQMFPPLGAYVEAANGDEDTARRQHNAATTREGLILNHWQEGRSLDDAMGLMRAEVEVDFKSGLWSAASAIQGASGQASLRSGWAHEVAKGFSPGKTQPPEEGGGGMAARTSTESAPGNMRARTREGSTAGPARRGPHRDTGGGEPPPKAAAKRLRATGTDPGAPMDRPALQNEKGEASAGTGRGSDAPSAMKRTGGGGSGKKPAAVQLPDPRQFDESGPATSSSEPLIRGAGRPKTPTDAKRAELAAKELLEPPTDQEKAVSELEPTKTTETGKKANRYGVKKHSERELTSLAGHAIEPIVVEAWGTPLEKAGFTVYRTDRPAGPNLDAPAGGGEGAAPARKEFVPTWYENRYQAFPKRFSDLFPGEGPDAIAVSASGDIIVAFDATATYSTTHFRAKAALTQRIADAFPQSRVYVQEGYWGEPTPGGGYKMLPARRIRPSGGGPLGE